MCLDTVEPHVELAEQRVVHAVLAQAALDSAFHFVRSLAQCHGAGHTGTALHGVQVAQQQTGGSAVLRRGFPGAQVLTEFGQGNVRFFQEDFQQRRIQRVSRRLADQFTNSRFGHGRLIGRCQLHQICGLLELRENGHFRQASGFVPSLCDLDKGLRGRLHWQTRAHQHALAQFLQTAAQRLVGFRPDTGGKLVQHAAHALDRLVEQAEVARVHRHRTAVQVQQHLLQRVGQLAHGLQFDHGGAALQRVRGAQGQLARRRAAFVTPFREIHAQAADQIVGFLQVDVVQRHAHAHRADDLHAIVVRRFFRRTGLRERERDHLGVAFCGNRLNSRRCRLDQFGGKFRNRLDNGLRDQRCGRLRHRCVNLRQRGLVIPRERDRIVRFSNRFDRCGRRFYRLHQPHRLGGQIERCSRFHCRHRRCCVLGGFVRFRHRLQPDERTTVAHALGSGDQRLDRVIGLRRLRNGGRPCRQFGFRAGEQRSQIMRGHAALGQPHVHHLLDGPGGLAVAGEANHAARTLERVERAAQLRQQVEVGASGQATGACLGRGVQRVQIGAHTGQHFFGFGQEDVEQLGIDGLRIARSGGRCGCSFGRCSNRCGQRSLQALQRAGTADLPCVELCERLFQTAAACRIIVNGGSVARFLQRGAQLGGQRVGRVDRMLGEQAVEQRLQRRCNVGRSRVLGGVCIGLRLAAGQHAGFRIEGKFVPGGFALGWRERACDDDLVDLCAGQLGTGRQRIEKTLQAAGVGSQCTQIAFAIGSCALACRFQRGDGRLGGFGGVHGLVGINGSKGALHLAEQAAGFLQATALLALSLEGVKVRFGRG